MDIHPAVKGGDDHGRKQRRTNGVKVIPEAAKNDSMRLVRYHGYLPARKPVAGAECQVYNDSEARARKGWYVNSGR